MQENQRHKLYFIKELVVQHTHNSDSTCLFCFC